MDHDRIERAASLAREWGNQVSDEEMARLLAAAYPELANGTAWLAPMEATEKFP